MGTPHDATTKRVSLEQVWTTLEVDELKSSPDIEEIVRESKKPLVWGDSRREAVKAVQAVLAAIGYQLGRSGPKRNGVDGDYRTKTSQALRGFQQSYVKGFAKDVRWQGGYPTDGRKCERITILALDEVAKGAKHAKGKITTPTVPTDLGATKVKLGGDGWLVVENPSKATIPSFQSGKDPVYRTDKILRDGVKNPRVVVLHNDASHEEHGKPGDFDKGRSNASVHFLIGRSGGLIQFASVKDATWHVKTFDPPSGAAAVHRRAGGAFKSVNRCSISIAFSNVGYLTHYAKGKFHRGASSLDPDKVVRKDGHGRMLWEVYTEEALRTFVILVRALSAELPEIKGDRVFGHEELSKTARDPGPAFPKEILSQLGGSSAVVRPKSGTLRGCILETAKTELARKIVEVGMGKEGPDGLILSTEGQNWDKAGHIQKYYEKGAKLWWTWKWKTLKEKPNWCCAFAVYCWRMAYEATKTPVPQVTMTYIGEKTKRKINKREDVISAGCGRFKVKLGKAGLWRSMSVTAEPGDILLSTHHAALVERVVRLSNGKRRYFTIEGNYTGSIKRSRFTEGSKRWRGLVGFGKPEA